MSFSGGMRFGLVLLVASVSSQSGFAGSFGTTTNDIASKLQVEQPPLLVDSEERGSGQVESFTPTTGPEDSSPPDRSIPIRYDRQPQALYHAVAADTLIHTENTGLGLTSVAPMRDLVGSPMMLDGAQIILSANSNDILQPLSDSSVLLLPIALGLLIFVHRSARKTI